MMKKILVINAGKTFAHSGGRLNGTITEWDKKFFTTEKGFEITVSEPGKVEYDPTKEVEKYLWADVVIYHFPIWWMYIPFELKEYFDKVFTAGHRTGMYYSDGRKADNPSRNYGTGGLLKGKKYFATTTWNAPETAFTIPDEFFQGRSVDDGVLFPFHKMHDFCGLEPLAGFHFHDVEKNGSAALVNQFQCQYEEHLNSLFKI